MEGASRTGMGSFHIPGALLSIKIHGPHLFVMYDEASTTLEYSLDNRPVFRNSEEGDCPLELKPKEWLTKSTVLVYRLTPLFAPGNPERWTIVPVIGGGGTPPSLIVNSE